MEKNSNIYEFKYEGSFHAIDAVTVLHTQLNFITILNEIKNYVAPETSLQIKLQGLKEGSLEIQQVIELAIPTGLFVVDNYGSIKKIFEIFSDVFKIKSFLGSKKASEVLETNNGVIIKIEGNNNNIIVSPEGWQIFQDNGKINDAIIKAGKSLSENQDIEKISVRRTANKKPIAKIEKEHFEKIKEENGYSIGAFNYENESDQIIGIKKANLLPEPGRVLKWDVMYRGQTVSVKISDQDFVSEIVKGLRFGNGDKLLVDLRKTMRLDKTYNMFVETGHYEAVKVHKLIPREDQSTLNLN